MSQRAPSLQPAVTGLQPATIHRQVLPGALLERWRVAAERAFADPAVRAAHGFVPTATSLRLSALDLDEIVAAVFEALGPQLAAILGEPLVVNLQNAWLRRQFPPDAAPAGHAPHGWHQDGALGYPFLDPPADDPGLAPLVTTWLPLDPCGLDAPGLELVPADRPDLLPLEALRPEAVDRAHPPASRLRPVLAAGDALVFGGGVLHRTWRAEGMRATRTSVELRWLSAAAIPARLAAQPHRKMPRIRELAPGQDLL